MDSDGTAKEKQGMAMRRRGEAWKGEATAPHSSAVDSQCVQCDGKDLRGREQRGKGNEQICRAKVMRTVDAPGNCTDKHRKSMGSGVGQRNRKAGKRHRNALRCSGIVQTDEHGYGIA